MPYPHPHPTTTSTYVFVATGRNSEDALNFFLLYAAETDPD